MKYSAVPPDGGWRLATVLLFLAIMAVWIWGVKWAFGAMPEALKMWLSGAAPALAIGYLLGLRTGRRQSRHPEEEAQ